jgi:hypothetical protein
VRSVRMQSKALVPPVVHHEILHAVLPHRPLHGPKPNRPAVSGDSDLGKVGVMQGDALRRYSPELRERAVRLARRSVQIRSRSGQR